MSYRILSLDGGGIRGLLTAILLERLEKEVPGFIDGADLLAGSSSGGVIALGLAHGLSPAELRDLFEQEWATVFDDSWLDDLRDLGKLVGAEYSTGNLARLLRRVFGETKLGDLRQRVLVPAFDLDSGGAERTWKPKFFHNYRGADSDGEQLVRKVALYTSAAPVYFPSVDGYIDGGVVANNPSVAAIAQTQDARSLRRRPDLENIVLLSAGAGKSLLYLGGRKNDWGYAQWARPLVRIMLEGVMDVADYQCRQILRSRYRRINPVFPPGKSVGLDESHKLPSIVSLAEQTDLAGTVAWLRRHWK